MRQPASIQQMQPKFPSSNNDTRYLPDQSQVMPNMNNNTYLQPNLNDHEFDLNFIQSNDVVSNLNATGNINQIIEEVEQKQLVQLIQQGNNNEMNSYQYQNQSVKQINTGKQNYQTINASSTYYQQQQQQQQRFQQTSTNYNNTYNNSVQQQQQQHQIYSNQQIRIEQSSSNNMYQSPNNQTIINYSSNDLMVNDTGESVLQHLLALD